MAPLMATPESPIRWHKIFLDVKSASRHSGQEFKADFFFSATVEQLSSQTRSLPLMNVQLFKTVDHRSQAREEITIFSR